MCLVVIFLLEKLKKHIANYKGYSWYLMCIKQETKSTLGSVFVSLRMYESEV